MAGSKATSSSSSGTDILDETLQHIRNDLSNLSTDRMAMETKMEGLVLEIQNMASSLYNYRRPPLQSSPVRRVRSSASPSSRSIVRKHSKGKEYASLAKQVRPKSGSKFSASSENMSNSLRERSSSASAYSSLEDIGAAKLGNRSFSVEGSWKKKTTIPELPESPNLCSVSSYSYSSEASSQDSSHGIILRCSNGMSTPPVPHQWQMKHHYSSLVTSTPNMQYCGAEMANNDEYYYTLPGKIKAANSQPHQMFSSNNVSQVDGCLDEESRKSKSVVMRRSSLTGQLEQFQRPYYKEAHRGVIAHQASAGYKVLNKGVKKNLKRRSTRLDQVILPGLETTV